MIGDLVPGTSGIKWDYVIEVVDIGPLLQGVYGYFIHLGLSIFLFL